MPPTLAGCREPLPGTAAGIAARRGTTLRAVFEPLVSLPETFTPSDGRWFYIKNRSVLLRDDGILPSGVDQVHEGVPHLMGVDDGSPIWAVDVSDDSDAPDSHRYIDLYSLYGSVSEEDFALAGRAVQIVTWDQDHRFCGRCGSDTNTSPLERVRKCGCGTMAYPRLSPAVIMLVERDDEMLLAHGRQFRRPFYSALAGFVEPGESLEQCVAREVKEEVGLDVDNVTYFASQPWPFPNSLMLGFKATYAGGDIVLQEEEIVDAGWFGPDNLPQIPTGGMSIAGWLIESFLNGHRTAPPSTDGGLITPTGADDAPAPKKSSIWDRTSS